MAITYTNYTATASQTNFDISFPYIDSSHVKVKIDGVASSAFSIVGSNVVLSSGASAGQIVRVYRQTPGRDADNKLMLVDFQDGSVLSETDLDKACQQLLYLAQEADETGSSSLPVDFDGHYTAGEKRIKDLAASTSDGDAATKFYVDGKALYGGAQSVPQTWAKVGSNLTGTTGDCTIALTDPTPFSDNDDLYVVTYNGFTQRPGTDFTVTESGGSYTFTLKMGGETLASSDTVTIRNFGVARNWIKQPLKGDTSSDVALTVQRHTDGQSANLQEGVTEAATPVVLASVNEDGDASFVDVTATGNAAVTGTSTLTGNTTVGGTLGVTGASTLTGNTAVGGTLGVTGAATMSSTLGVTGAATLSSTAAVGGAATLSSTLGVTGATTLSGGVSGNLNLLDGILQMAGTGVMTIRQITTATYDTTAGSDHTITDTANYKIYGVSTTITPQSSSSHIIIIATPMAYGSVDNGDSSDLDLNLKIALRTGSSTQNAAGQTMAGSVLDSSLWKILSRSHKYHYGQTMSPSGDDATGAGVKTTGETLTSDHEDVVNRHHHDLNETQPDEEYLYLRNTMIVHHQPGSTTQQRYDVVGQCGNSASNLKCYPSLGYSNIIAIEIG